MRTAASACRRIAQAAIVVIGVVTIVGSGGGAIGFPDTTPTFGPLPPTPTVSISPGEPTVQAGTIVRFDARVAHLNPPVTYQWRRDGVDIAGATSASYVLGGAQLGDDLARFQVIASSPNDFATSVATLHVSPVPPAAYEDVDFVPSTWSAFVASASDGATYTASQPPSGGNPGPYRLLTHQLPAGVTVLQLVHRGATAAYAPATQGAIYTIDYALDCAVVGRSAGLAPMDPQVAITFEQAGRLYQLQQWTSSCSSGWNSIRGFSLEAGDIKLLAGATCGANERCPDFTASAPPLQFGFTTWVRTASASVAGTLDLGIDNWKVTIWKK
jgi:hypothetical protein